MASLFLIIAKNTIIVYYYKDDMEAGSGIEPLYSDLQSGA
jgi:hypothetical protein